ncbi:unnamed protein product [Prorocentrum cordatum]|uniref:Subtilisin n=1 Tax=Prorocentrum cordatum TaxID=2364126 RepID=A0ABN9PJS1_9DINO|nr:unnamed protein product [Polarella glacialis]
MRRTFEAAVAALLVLRRLRVVGAESLDIVIELFQDPLCYEFFSKSTYMDSICYANLYTDGTSIAFAAKIIDFADGDQGRNIFAVGEYSDDCYSLYSAKRIWREGECNPWIGPNIWAMMSTKPRSKTCQGDGCSRLSQTIQTFYEQSGCTGLQYAQIKFPVQSECLRYYNGTQKFAVDGAVTTITQTDYPLNDNCCAEGCATEAALGTVYSLENERCYTFYKDKAPRSFKWTMDIYSENPGGGGAGPRVPPLAVQAALGLAAWAATAPA